MARMRLDAIAVHVYQQIGFPTRRALLRDLVDRGVSLLFRTNVEAEVHAARLTTGRLVGALNTLFEACAAVCHERIAAGLPHLDAAPMILLDQVLLELVRDERIARAGGSAVFSALAWLLVVHYVEAKAVRAAVSGNSALLSVFMERTFACFPRVFLYRLPDPEPEAVLRALRAKGYTAREAEDMVALCGTRLRLLERPLRLGAAEMGAHAFMDAARATAAAQFVHVLSAASDADARVLVSTLDALAQCEERGACDAPPWLGRDFTTRLAKASSKVLFVRLDCTLAFQSRLHAHVWRHERDSLLRTIKSLSQGKQR